jgi:hypothetical protein
MKVGTDVSLIGSDSDSGSQSFLPGTTPQSTGTVWSNITIPGAAKVWDKTTIEARVDPVQDQGKVGATLSRSVSLGHDLSVTLQNSYSVAHALTEHPPAATTATVTAVGSPPPTGPPSSAPIWTADQSVRLNLNGSGTTLSAGGGTSNLDDQWHNKLSVEQTLFGPLKVTTSVEDAGSSANKKSVTAAFKRAW